MKSYFLFKTNEGHYIVENKDVQKVPKPSEILTRTATYGGTSSGSTRCGFKIKL